MSNPLLGNIKMPSPLQNIMQIKNQMQQFRQNPQGVADFLKQSGRITEDQYEQIKGMNGNFSQIGQFLMGSAPQNMVGQIQNGVNTIQKQL